MIVAIGLTGIHAHADGITPHALPHPSPRPGAAPFRLCHPDARLAFYDPQLPHSSQLRATAKTHIQARRLDSLPARGIYQLSGKAKITRADQQIQARRIDYNDQTGDIDARGNVRYQQSGELLRADRLKASLRSNRGIAEGRIGFQLLKSHGNGQARRVRLLDARRSRYSQVSYSTCDAGHHLWEIRAREITLDRTSGRGIARDTTMRLGQMPFLYLPYFSFPIDKRRTSGLLYPKFGHGSRSGYLFGIPYYLNLAPGYDLTLEPRLYSRRGAMLAGQARYLRSGGHSGQLDFTYLARDRFNDGKRSPPTSITHRRQRWLLKYAQHDTLWPGWSFDMHIDRASDRHYLRDFGNDLHTIATGTLASQASLHGSGNRWHASLGVDRYQNVDPSLPDSAVQYRRWPRATFTIYFPMGHWFETGLRSEAVAFRKPGAIEGDRLDLYPYLGAYFQGAAWFVHPKLAWRYTAYQLAADYTRYGYNGPLAGGQTSPFNQAAPHRSLPITSIDSGLFLERDARLLGRHYTQTLEPRLYYLYVPYRRQDNLPLFDTAVMSLDYWQLFWPNSYSGGDRQMNANNLTGAITSRLLDADGTERLSLSLGQIRYFTPPRVMLAHTTGTDISRSDYVVQLSSRLGSRWRLAGTFQWNPQTRRTSMAAMELQHRLGSDGVANLAYRFRRPVLEQYSGSIAYPLSDHWHLLGYWTYSARSHRTVQAAAGFGYEGCCVRLSLLGRHYVTGYDGLVSPPHARSGTSNAVMFELEFKGIGTLDGHAGRELRRGILGYQ